MSVNQASIIDCGPYRPLPFIQFQCQYTNKKWMHSTMPLQYLIINYSLGQLYYIMVCCYFILRKIYNSGVKFIMQFKSLYIQIDETYLEILSEFAVHITKQQRCDNDEKSYY